MSLLLYLIKHNDDWVEINYSSYDEMVKDYMNKRNPTEDWINTVSQYEFGDEDYPYVPRNGIHFKDDFEVYQNTLVYWNFSALTKFIFHN